MQHPTTPLAGSRALPAQGSPVLSAAPARIQWVNAARGLAIVLVVFFHVNDWVTSAGVDSRVWDDTIHVVTGLRMPVFFVIAGLLGARWRTVPWRRLAVDKLALLVWVYLLWQVIGTSTAPLSAQMSGTHLEFGRVLVSLAATPIRPRFELWFLWALVVYFLVARASVNLPISVPIQFGVALAVSAVTLSNVVNLGSWDDGPSHYVFFFIGMNYRPLVIRVAAIFETSVRARLLMLVVWLSVAIGLYLSGADQVIGPDLLVRLLGMGAGVAVAVVLARRSLFTYLGARTLPIYLAHVPLTVVGAYVIHLNRGASVIQALAPALPVILTAAVVPAALGLHAVAMRTPLRVLYRPPERVMAAVRRRAGLAAGPSVAPRPAADRARVATGDLKDVSTA